MTSNTIPADKPKSLYSSLPFFASRRPKKGQLGNRNFWSVKPSGDYFQDCKTGQAYALLFLEAEEVSDCGTLLQCVVADMPRDAAFTGLEVGFMEVIGFAATAGAFRAREIASHWDRCEAERKLEASNARAPRRCAAKARAK